MKLYKTPGIFKKMYPDFLWNKPSDEHTIYLTFDDGPTPDVTDWVLKVLKEYKAKATFFVIGNNAEKHPEILKKVLKEGHGIGNHTYNHLKGRKTDSQDYFNDFLQCNDLIETKLFRPPYGSIKGKQAKWIAPYAKIIMWDVLTYDWIHDLDTNHAIEKIQEGTNSGSIIVFHDSLKAEKNLKVMLPILLKYWSEKGFEFKAITA